MMERRHVLKSGRVQACLAATVVAGFFLVLLLLFLPRETGDDVRDARLIMLGALTAGFANVLGYFFGSTSTSEAKNQLLANSTPTPIDPVTVSTTSADAATLVVNGKRPEADADKL